MEEVNKKLVNENALLQIALVLQSKSGQAQNCQEFSMNRVNLIYKMICGERGFRFRALFKNYISFDDLTSSVEFADLVLNVIERVPDSYSICLDYFTSFSSPTVIAIRYHVKVEDVFKTIDTVTKRIKAILGEKAETIYDSLTFFNKFEIDAAIRRLSKTDNQMLFDLFGEDLDSVSYIQNLEDFSKKYPELRDKLFDSILTHRANSKVGMALSFK